MSSPGRGTPTIAPRKPGPDVDEDPGVGARDPQDQGERDLPGAVKTAATRTIWASPEREAELLELIPYGRWGQAADIARAAVWLTSDASDYMTGTTLYVDGGMRLYPIFGGGI